MSEALENSKTQQSKNKELLLNLLESSNSVEQHVYLQKDECPEKINQYYLGNGGDIIGGKTTTKPKVELKDVQSTLKF